MNGEELGELAISIYEGTSSRDRRGAQLAEWRCGQGCMLLYVWRSPSGVLFYQPGYKLSPGRNAAESNASARAKNTTDGFNHWKPVAGLLEPVRGSGREGGLHLECRHHRGLLLGADIFEVVDAATPGRPVRVLM